MMCVVALAPAPASLTGCVISCPDVYVADAVTVEVPKTLYVAGGVVSLELCDGGDCATDEVQMPTEWRGWPAKFALFADDLEDKFEEGEVTAQATITDAQRAVIARREGTISLSWYEPHGKSCQRALTGEVVFATTDRVDRNSALPGGRALIPRI